MYASRYKVDRCLLDELLWNGIGVIPGIGIIYFR